MAEGKCQPTSRLDWLKTTGLKRPKAIGLSRCALSIGRPAAVWQSSLSAACQLDRVWGDHCALAIDASWIVARVCSFSRYPRPYLTLT